MIPLETHLWRCYELYVQCFGKREWCFDRRLARKSNCKNRVAAVWTAGVETAMELISPPSWHQWPQKLAESCARIWWTCWVKGLTITLVYWQGTPMPIRVAPLLGQQGQRAQKGRYLFHLRSYGHEISQRRVQVYKWCSTQRIHHKSCWING